MSPANRIVAENCLPGNPREEWDVGFEGDPEIQGFATDISVNLGETVSFKIRTHSPSYRIDIYRMGWYGGAGARLIETFRPSASLPQAQPDCRIHTNMRFVDCGNWKVSASWQVPADEGGSAEYIATKETLNFFRHWQALSNELSNPKVVRCPRDGNRRQATTFADGDSVRKITKGTTLFADKKGKNGNLSVSYFIGKGADEAKPNNILSGDRNINFAKYVNDKDKKGQHVKFMRKFSAKKTPYWSCLLYTSPSPRDGLLSRMPSSA